MTKACRDYRSEEWNSTLLKNQALRCGCVFHLAAFFMFTPESQLFLPQMIQLFCNLIDGPSQFLDSLLWKPYGLISVSPLPLQCTFCSSVVLLDVLECFLICWSGWLPVLCRSLLCSQVIPSHMCIHSFSCSPVFTQCYPMGHKSLLCLLSVVRLHGRSCNYHSLSHFLNDIMSLYYGTFLWVSLKILTRFLEDFISYALPVLYGF